MIFLLKQGRHIENKKIYTATSLKREDKVIESEKDLVAIWGESRFQLLTQAESTGLSSEKELEKHEDMMHDEEEGLETAIDANKEDAEDVSDSAEDEDDEDDDDEEDEDDEDIVTSVKRKHRGGGRYDIIVLQNGKATGDILNNELLSKSEAIDFIDEWEDEN